MTAPSWVSQRLGRLYGSIISVVKSPGAKAAFLLARVSRNSVGGAGGDFFPPEPLGAKMTKLI